MKFLEESPQRFFRTCTNSLIVCADCVGMSGRLNKNVYSTIGLSAQEGV